MPQLALENPADVVALLGISASRSHPQKTVRFLSSTWNVEPVLHAVAVTAGRGEDVGALAVGVVDDHVEHRHPAQPRRVLVGQDEALPVLVLLNV